MADRTLVAQGLRKRFGAIVATDSLDLELRAAEIHALIGPNGAGKTTVLAQLAGELRPDAGTIHLMGRDVTRMASHRRALLGLGRSFQISSLFEEFSVEDNIALALQAHQGHSFRFWSSVRRDPELRCQARTQLQLFGLTQQADSPVSTLAHGERRQLEVAMALAGSPRCLLLDEPMAGLGPGGTRRMTETLRSLKGQLSILLIEHDMDVVFSLADRVSVLVYGRCVATGTPAEIRANEEVRKAYLGKPD
jgi:branched-chain amino acid transport system ATP-binding protein